MMSSEPFLISQFVHLSTFCGGLSELTIGPVSRPRSDKVTSTDSPPVGSKVPSHWHPPALRWSTIAVVIVLFIGALVAIHYAFDLMPIVERFEVTDNAY